MENDNKVVFIRRDVTEVDWGVVKCLLCTKIKTTDEFLRCVVDRFPLLGTPLEVESGMYDLSPTTKFDREVERCSKDIKILNRRSPRFFQELNSTLWLELESESMDIELS